MMRLDLRDLRDSPSFALFGPGFSDDGTWSLVSPLGACEGSRARVVFAGYEDRDGACAAFDGPETRVQPGFPTMPVLEPRLDAGLHADGVRRIREAIAAGDVYQVNLTLRASFAPLPGDAVLARLCGRGIPPFAAWVRLPDGREFVSASPELFFELDGRRIVSEPMKGTRPAGEVALLDASEKDGAELAMITDLVRNDLTPICEPASVVVEAERTYKELPYAVQAVSRIAGKLLENVTLPEVLRALHPGGSITGAPKPMALRMIEQLESTPRGAYCGTLARVDGSRVVASLLIRTAERASDRWVYGVGGGIVWDSEAVSELQEIHVKLGALR